MTLQPSKVLAAVLDSKPQLAQVLPCWSAQAKVGLRWKHVQLPLVHTPNGGDVHAVLSGRLVWVGQVPVESQVTPGVHSVPVVPQALLGTHWVHALARQTVFAGQALPQRAQLPALFVRSTHALLQFVWVDAQQIPLEQFGVVPPQAWPHVPQLVGSVLRLTHLPLQGVVGMVQLRQPVPLQKPLEQVLVAACAQLPEPSQC